MEVRGDAKEDGPWGVLHQGSFVLEVGWLPCGPQASSEICVCAEVCRCVCAHSLCSRVLDRREVQICGPLHGGFPTCLHRPPPKAVFSIHSEPKQPGPYPATQSSPLESGIL